MFRFVLGGGQGDGRTKVLGSTVRMFKRFALESQVELNSRFGSVVRTGTWELVSVEEEMGLPRTVELKSRGWCWGSKESRGAMSAVE